MCRVVVLECMGQCQDAASTCGRAPAALAGAGATRLRTFAGRCDRPHLQMPHAQGAPSTDRYTDGRYWLGWVVPRITSNVLT